LARGAWRGGELPGRLGTMRGLTLWRPWPFLIVRPDVTDPAERQRLYATGQAKAIENRSWRPPAGIRRLIYTTNSVEAYNRQLRY
jgi:hypothetical protein